MSPKACLQMGGTPAHELWNMDFNHLLSNFFPCNTCRVFSIHSVNPPFSWAVQGGLTPLPTSWVSMGRSKALPWDLLSVYNIRLNSCYSLHIDWGKKWFIYQKETKKQSQHSIQEGKKSTLQEKLLRALPHFNNRLGWLMGYWSTLLLISTREQESKLL